MRRYVKPGKQYIIGLNRRVPMRLTSLVIGCALVATGLLSARAGATTAPNECVQACRATEGDCLFDAHERAKQCEEECGDERDLYRTACLDENVDETCPEKREALQGCLSTCGDRMRTDQGKCSQARKECVDTTCDLPPRPARPYPWGHRGPFRR